MWWRMREALDSADLVITGWEARADRAIGRTKRRAVERYVSLVILGIPIAWIGAGLRFDRVAAAGLAVGIALYAVIDVTRITLRAAKDAREERSSRR
jgi:hypothetical protein